MRSSTIIFCAALAACGPQVPDGVADTGGTTSSATTTTTTATATAGSADDSEVDDDDDGPHFDDGFASDLPPQGDCSIDDPCLLDVLVVFDNSGTMADAQYALTKSLVRLVGRIEARARNGQSFIDVQMMFTTTDMGNPLCTPFQKPDYLPAMGAPIGTGCNERINRFTGLGNDPPVREEVCQNLCSNDIVPADAFVAFAGTEANVPDGASVDVDGDGLEDSRAAQAVACLAPQGIDGCGYESPLESMLQALNPDAPWNEGDRPFLRADSDILVLVATDETDCSMDGNVWEDPTYWEVHPGSENAQPSSALCWNAGMSCGAPDADGVYADCITADTALQPVSRYTEHLDWLEEDQERSVFVVAVTGVPQDGGLDELVLRDWREDDLFAQEVKDGEEVEDKAWEFKIGPGCTDFEREVRGLPNPRLNEVCASANVATVLEVDGTQCCVESICNDEPALACVDDFVDVIVYGHSGFG